MRFLLSSLSFFFTSPSTDTPTLRPIRINVVYNAACETPRASIRRDAQSGKGDVVVADIARLPEELRARNVACEQPLTVTYETASMLNVSFVDTPGMPAQDSSDRQRVDDLVARLVASSGDQRTRLVLLVEQAGEWPCWVSAWAQKAKIAVSFLVLTDTRAHVASVTSTPALNKFVADRPMGHAGCFFLALPAPQVLASSAEKFCGRVWASDQLLRTAVAGVDKRFEALFGAERLHAALFDLFLKSYRQLVPVIRQQHKQIKAGAERELMSVSQQLANLTPWKLRGVAMNYVTSFLHLMQSLLEGTIESLPAGYNLSFGQTLAQETMPSNGGTWPGRNGLPLLFDPDKWDIPACMRPLVGRQQFERLLAEFRAVVEHCEMDPLANDEIVTAMGVQKSLTSLPALHWVACDLARIRIEQQILPLIHQFHYRIIYVLKRLADTAQSISKAPKKLQTPRTRLQGDAFGGEPSGDYPFFATWLAEQYHSYVERLTDVFFTKCNEEFYPTRIMAWELERIDKKAAPTEDVSAVKFLAAAVFDQTKARIARNVLLKCYNIFLECAFSFFLSLFS